MSVVQLADMKAHLRVDFTTDDTLIQSKIDAAEAWIQVFTGRAFLTQTQALSFNEFGRCLALPVLVQSITSITYLDQTLTQQTLASGNYVATPLNAEFVSTYIYPANGTCWPSTARVKLAVTVTFQCGYGTAANVPMPLCEAIMLLVAHWYENREASVVGVTSAELPLGLMDLLTPYRAWVF